MREDRTCQMADQCYRDNGVRDRRERKPNDDDDLESLKLSQLWYPAMTEKSRSAVRTVVTASTYMIPAIIVPSPPPDQGYLEPIAQCRLP